ncbi:hypothetical protein GPALN_014629 [Globodera pallida]|nr:hypothetical protein GPALN_014629 [Globodera pallida]
MDSSTDVEKVDFILERESARQQVLLCNSVHLECVVVWCLCGAMSIDRTIQRRCRSCPFPKVASLKHILYAFRFYNQSVEYCQGLFWFLVACVDHLQPPNYYTPSLLGSVVDQRVLLDLVVGQNAHIAHAFAELEVDLPLFTLSWFLTSYMNNTRG